MTQELKPAVPSLHAFSNPLMTTKEDVAVYLIQFLFANPGNTSSMNEGEMMSFRKLVAMHGTVHLDTLATKIGDMLTTSLLHYFPNDRLTATCAIIQEDGFGEENVLKGTYGVEIAIRDENGTAVIPRSKIKVERNGDAFRMVE